MYNKVQNSPARESYITFDILGGDLTQSTGNARDLINSVLSSLNSIVANSWNGYYNALYQVNNVISIVEDLPESDLRNLIIGEAHYFRAYIYHSLVTRWGGVPIQRVNTMDKPFRDSEEAVWAFIEEELETALACFLGDFFQLLLCIPRCRPCTESPCDARTWQKDGSGCTGGRSDKGWKIQTG